MTPVVERLRASGDIAATLRGRRQHGGDLAVVFVRPGPLERDVRIAVVASRRVGGAVQRNRAKRLLREAARLLRWRPGHDIVLVARASAVSSTLGAVVADVARSADSLGVLEAGTRD